MKRFDCLVPGCTWHTEADGDAEVVRRATEHLRNVHGEAVIRPDMVSRIKERVHDAEGARP